jgi:hypothetical protein
MTFYKEYTIKNIAVVLATVLIVAACSTWRKYPIPEELRQTYSETVDVPGTSLIVPYA